MFEKAAEERIFSNNIYVIDLYVEIDLIDLHVFSGAELLQCIFHNKEIKKQFTCKE